MTDDPTKDEFTEVGHDDKAKRTHRVATQRRKARHKRNRAERSWETPQRHEERHRSHLSRTRSLKRLFHIECEQEHAEADECFVFIDLIDEAELPTQTVFELTDQARRVDEFYEEHPLLVDARELSRLGCFHVDDPRAVYV